MNLLQIIHQIVRQTDLILEEVLDRIDALSYSLKYGLDRDTNSYDDPTIAKLLAQELNVDLGNPTEYLYAVLLYENSPFSVKIIPFVTIDKEIIKEKFQFLFEEEGLDFRDTCLREGILINFSYDFQGHSDIDSFPANDISYEEIVDKAKLIETFIDYRIVRTVYPNKTYLPYSIFARMPEWLNPRERENWPINIEFPYITLESFQVTPEIQEIVLSDIWVKEIIGTEALQRCSNLKKIYYSTEPGYGISKFDIPPTVSLPKLEVFYLYAAEISHLDLSFLRNCHSLREIIIESSVIQSQSTHDSGNLILPPFTNHLFLEKIKIVDNDIDSLSLETINCPNLFEIDLTDCHLKNFDLSALKNCSSLHNLDLYGNFFESLDLSPLQHCQQLQYLNLSDAFYSGVNKFIHIDLSPLKYCTNLQNLHLSSSSLKELDLSPLGNCTALEVLFLPENQSNVDTSHLLQSLPNLEIIYSKS